MSTPDNDIHAIGFVSCFNEMAKRVHETAVDKGWWDMRDLLVRVAAVHEGREGTSGLTEFAKKAVASQMIALEHSELSEGLEGIRKDLNDDKIPEFTMEEAEAADTIIRIMDRGVSRKLRIAEAIIAKMAMNKTREHLHGGKAF